MTHSTLWQKPLTELLDLQSRREVSRDEILASLSARADATDPKVRAYLARPATPPAGARLQPSAPVLPIAIKDNLCTTDFPTTCASKILEGYRPPFDATAVSLLRAAGASFTGKTNCDEFAMGSSSENSGFFKTHNPWDLSRVPGGSSGGSAAAVAAGMAPVALGSDTGGSVRQPAAYCGLVGLRPTYGLVSRYGLIAFASSLDQIGVLARTVEDCALVLGIIARHDPSDSTSVGFPSGAAFDWKEVRRPQKASVGIIKEMRTHAGNEPCVDSNFEQSIRQFESLGFEIREVSVPHIGYSLDCYYLIAPAEASSNLARYDGVRYGLRATPAAGESARDPLVAMFEQTRRRGFGDEVKRRILIGTFVLRSGYYEAYYQKAMSLRKVIADEFADALQHVDVLLTPSAPEPAFRFGEKSESPLKMYLTDFYTLPAPLAGIPALSFPSGFVEIGKRRLPLSLQLMGRPFEELTLLRTAYAFGEATGLKNLLPVVEGVPANS